MHWKAWLQGVLFSLRRKTKEMLHLVSLSFVGLKKHAQHRASSCLLRICLLHWSKTMKVPRLDSICSFGFARATPRSPMIRRAEASEARNAFQKLSGEYRLSQQHANGHPIWQRAGWGEEAYLYSGRSGKWPPGDQRPRPSTKTEERRSGSSFLFGRPGWWRKASPSRLRQ